MNELHHRLRSAREKAGINQAQLATILDVVPSAVSHWENGRRKPGRDLLAKIAEVTLTEPAALLEIEAKIPQISLRPRKIKSPNQEKYLTDAERELVTFWRALSERQRQNFLKLIRVSFRVRGEIEGEGEAQ